MARKTHAEAQVTRTQILDAAETVFLKRGVAHASLEEIARIAGVTRGAVYWHFRNKVDVFEALLERVRLPLAELLPPIEGAVTADPLRMLRDMCVYAMRGLAEDSRQQRVYTILLHRCEFVDEMHPLALRLDQMAEDFLRLLEGYFAAAKRSGALDPGLTPTIAAYALHVYLMGLYRGWLQSPAGIDLVNEAPRLADALFAGLRMPAAAPPSGKLQGVGHRAERSVKK